MVCKANFTIYLHNKGRNGLVTLNPQSSPTLHLVRVHLQGWQSFIAEGEDSTRHLHDGFSACVQCAEPGMRVNHYGGCM